MTDFLLELRSEEIPARMQAKARDDLARLFADEIGRAGLSADAIETFATPRRLALIARGLPETTTAVAEETKGPRASAPPQALEGFLRKTGLAREDLVERDGVLFAVVEKPGRATIDVLAETIPAIVRGFPWPKSMRWGAASADMASPRWVRPLRGIVALFGEAVVPCEAAGVASGATTLGHRFHHPGPVTIGSAEDYALKLRACHVIVDQAEREAIVRDGAARAAEAAGLVLVPDEGLVIENAGLTEWPVPLLGRFDPAFLEVPREVIVLTMRTNQKYFACVSSSPSLLGEGDHAEHGGGATLFTSGAPNGEVSPSTAFGGPPPQAALGEEPALAPAFVCTANIEARDGGAAIVAGNAKVLAARLSDARFFWEQDLKVPLAEQARKLDRIVFHEKLGTVADKVERVAKLARWLVEEGIVKSSPSLLGEGDHAEHGGGAPLSSSASFEGEGRPSTAFAGPPPRDKPGEDRKRLADLADQAARLAKADLVTGMVGEFPELQGVMGGYYARAEGLPPQVADAIRDHYKPVGQGDEVPTAPVTVAVSLADKLDTLVAFFIIREEPTGSKDPYALRRAILGIIRLVVINDLRFDFFTAAARAYFPASWNAKIIHLLASADLSKDYSKEIIKALYESDFHRFDILSDREVWIEVNLNDRLFVKQSAEPFTTVPNFLGPTQLPNRLTDFLIDRLKVQQREAGVRHDLIDAVFALGGEDDLVRLLARVKALQTFVGTEDGANLLAGYKRAANILAKEEWSSGDDPALTDSNQIGYTPLPEEESLRVAVGAAEPMAAGAIEAEDFEGAMRALAGLRGPVDAFFERVTVNDPDPAKRAARLALLARVRDAIDRVADFSKIAG